MKRVLQGKKNTISVRKINSMQAKRIYRKGCMLFSLQISKNEEVDIAIGDEEVEFLQRYPFHDSM